VIARLSTSAVVHPVARPRTAWLGLCLGVGLVAASGCGEDPAPPTRPSPTPPATVTAGVISRIPGAGFVLATSFVFTASEFTASDGATLTYTWDFGDGGRQTGGPNVAHRYGGPGAFTVTTIAASAGGASASASVGPISVVTVDGRWGLQLIGGDFLVRNSAITQTGTTVTGDDTALNCRFGIGGEVTGSGIAVTWTRAERDCAGRNLPVAFAFRGEADQATGGFVGALSVLDSFTAARLVPCRGGPCG